MKTKVIKVGIKIKWEKDDKNERYTQLKENNGVGMVQSTFEVNKQYSVKDVIDMAISKFTSPKAQNYIQYSTHKLGVNADKREIEIEKFCDNNGKDVGLIEYFHLYDLFRNRRNLYLLCTATEDFWGEAGKLPKIPSPMESDEENRYDTNDDVSPRNGNNSNCIQPKS